MSKKINIKFILAVLVGVLSMQSCNENQHILYDENQKDLVFFNYKNDKNQADSVITYNFNYDIAKEHVIEIPVSLMGLPRSENRKIELRTLQDSTDMVEGVHYTIESAELPANSIDSKIRIKLFRDKDPKIQEKEFRLTLLIHENDALKPTGSKMFTIKYSDIRPTERPSWWSTWASLPKYSFEAAQVFFEYFYRNVPEASKSVYDEMIISYGDYFVKAKDRQGPMAMYDKFLIRYVLMPMYKDTGDRFEWQRVPSL